MIAWIKKLLTIAPKRPKYILKEKVNERYNVWKQQYEVNNNYVIYSWCTYNKKYLFEDIFNLKEVAEARIKHLEELENQ